MNAAVYQESGERSKVLVAIVLSLLLHLLFILGVGVTLAWKPSPARPTLDEPVELILVEPVKTKPAYIATSDSQRSEKAPDKPRFESDKDTKAASNAPADGQEALPSQDGRENPALQFENQNNTLGRQARPTTAGARTIEQQGAPPTPKAEATATPRPQAELALLEPPKPKTETQPESREQKSKVENEKSQAKPLPGYQPETRVTRIRGNISNRGRSAVDAAATPLGRYKKELSDAIGSRWYYYVNEQMGLLNVGTVDIRFRVRQNGKVENIQVLHNSSNESFASVSVQAIMEAEIPPIPTDVARSLQGGRIEIDYSFAIISN